MDSSPTCKYSYNHKLVKEIEIIEVLITIIIVALGIISLISYPILKNQITKEISNYGLSALFLITFVIELIPNILNPVFGLIVSLASGFYFYPSLIICIFALIIGGIIGFELGKSYGFKIVCAMVKKETLEKILRFKERYGNFFMFLSSFSPLPYFPIVFGAILVERKDFIVYGLIPRILFVIAAGYFFQIGVIG